MNVVGRFYSYFGSPKEGFLYFRAKEYVDLSNFMGKTLRLKIEDAETDGEIIRYVVEQESTTIIFAIVLTRNTIKALDGNINEDVMFSFEITDKGYIPLKRVNLEFYKKIKRTVARAARELGITSAEMERAVRTEWGDPKFVLNSMVLHLDAMGFYEFLLEYIDRYDIGIDTYVEDNQIQAYIHSCRKRGVCVVCKEPIVDKPSLYPLCEKHFKEYMRNKSIFKEKYKLLQ